MEADDVEVPGTEPDGVGADLSRRAEDVVGGVTVSKGASALGILGAFAFVAVGTAIGYALIRWGPRKSPFQLGDQASVYGLLLVFAGAVERILEPFSNLLPGVRARSEYARAVHALANGHPTASHSQVAAARAKLGRDLANRTVLMWGLATGIAAVVSALGGFYVLHMMAASGVGTRIPTWVDALVTGLVVGTGTKPVHDLVVRAAAVKEQRKSPCATAGRRGRRQSWG
jgi:hypothetical protein